MIRSNLVQRSSPGRSLVSLLRHANVTREQAAEMLGVSVDTVNKWCRDRSSMRVVHLARLLSWLAERAAVADDLQSFVSEFLTASGLTPAASARLSPPMVASSHDERVVLLVAADGLSARGLRLVVAGARDYLEPMGAGILLASADGAPSLSASTLADLILNLKAEPYGVLVLGDPGGKAAQLALDAAAKKATPVVGLQLPADLQEQMAANVTVPNYALGYDAAQYLISQGHTRLCVVGRSIRATHIADRIKGFEQAVWEKGLALSASAGPEVPPGTDRERSAPAEDPVARWCAMAREASRGLAMGDVTGIFCPFDSAALALATEFSQSGIGRGHTEAPNVVAVTTSRWPDLVSGPNMAYYVLPSFQMGYEGARLLTLVTSIGTARMSVRTLELQCEFRVAHCH